MMRILNAFVVLGFPCSQSFQTSNSRPLVRKNQPVDEDLKLFKLDDTEVANQGSRCLDGSSPGFYFGSGSEEGKWVFWLQGGGYCTNETSCMDYLPVHDWEDTMPNTPLQSYMSFASYNRVYLKNCDLGIFMGDRTDPVVFKGQKLYFQGSRILKHVIDTLSKNYTMTEVLLAGGSGGGHSIYGVADYFKKLLPATVHKYRVAPINGWFVSDKIELSSMMEMQQMSNVISERCSQAYGSTENYNCLDPSVGYQHIGAPVFMTQIFDYTFKWDNPGTDFANAYGNCISTEQETTGACTDDGILLLNEVMTNYTDGLASYGPSSRKGNGGYVSTCTIHIFYDDEEYFNTYANKGVTLGAAILQWWNSENAEPVWYLPCTLGGQSNQCEQTCGA